VEQVLSGSNQFQFACSSSIGSPGSSLVYQCLDSLSLINLI